MLIHFQKLIPNMDTRQDSQKCKMKIGSKTFNLRSDNVDLMMAERTGLEPASAFAR